MSTYPVAGCKGCGHWRGIYNKENKDKTGACHYLYDTGHSRGCPPGKDCIWRDERYKAQAYERSPVALPNSRRMRKDRVRRTGDGA